MAKSWAERVSFLDVHSCFSEQGFNGSTEFFRTSSSSNRAYFISDLKSNAVQIAREEYAYRSHQQK